MVTHTCRTNLLASTESRLRGNIVYNLWTCITVPGSRMGTVACICAITALMVMAWDTRTHAIVRSIRVVFTIVLTYLLAYASHRWILHGGIIPGVRHMHRMHHEPLVSRAYQSPGRLAEHISDISIACMVMLIILPLVPFGIIDLPALVFASVGHTTGHLLIYHSPHDPTGHDRVRGAVHEAHHQRPDTNFGPYLLDLVFGTNDAVIEYSDHVTLTFVLALLAALFTWTLLIWMKHKYSHRI